MHITYDNEFFIFVCTYQERESAKERGFRWHRERRQWVTQQLSTAVEYVSMADDKAKKAIVEQTSVIDASKKLSSDVVLLGPETESYLPFQRAGIEFSLADRRMTLIADEPGLGKTIQAIGVINNSDCKTVLIVCPKSIKYVWRTMLETWLVRKDVEITITHYERLRITAHPAVDLLVVDEAHYIKTTKSQRTKAVFNVVAKKTLLLTGTPILNRPIELWGILHHYYPDRFKSWVDYATKFCAAYQSRYGWWTNGASHLDQLQTELRSCCMIRRLFDEVLPELPAKFYQTICIDNPIVLDEERRVLADVDVSNLDIDSLNIRQRDDIFKARHTTAIMKAVDVAQQCKEFLESENKIVLFAHHRDVISILMQALEKFSPVVITGETKMDDREAAVKRFQEDETCRVFVGSIGAAGVGITLTASHTVVFAELAWTPGEMSQAEDRCHRIGQKDNVMVYHIVLAGSYDEELSKMLIRKQKIIVKALNHQEVKNG